MSTVGIWRVTDKGPQRLEASTIDLEHKLEAWIEKDPSLIDPGLTIVGRQIHLDCGPADLLALDPQGRWVVIEIKRGQLRRDAVTQAIDYAACLAEAPFDQLAEKANAYLASKSGDGTLDLESILKNRPGIAEDNKEEREVVIFLVGTGQDPGLERMVAYLSRGNILVRVVLFDIYQLPDGDRVLVRELPESDTEAPREETKIKFTMERILAMAKGSGLERQMQLLLDAAKKHDLYPRPYKTSFGFTHPLHRQKNLFVAWAYASEPGMIDIWVLTETFPEFYPISVGTARSIIGPGSDRRMNPEQLDDFIKKLDLLFEKIDKSQQSA